MNPKYRFCYQCNTMTKHVTYHRSNPKDNEYGCVECLKRG